MYRVVSSRVVLYRAPLRVVTTAAAVVVVFGGVWRHGHNMAYGVWCKRDGGGGGAEREARFQVYRGR